MKKTKTNSIEKIYAEKKSAAPKRKRKTSAASASAKKTAAKTAKKTVRRKPAAAKVVRATKPAPSQPEKLEAIIVSKSAKFTGKTRKDKQMLRDIMLVVGALVLIFVLVCVGERREGYRTGNNQAAVVNNASQQKMTASVREAVASMFAVPTDEDAILMTVTDSTQAPDNEFFTQIQDGDKLLVYVKNKLTIVYRPSADRIVAVSCDPTIVDLTEPPAQVASTSGMDNGQANMAKIAVYNGARISGMANRIGNTLTAAIPGAEVIAKTNATGSYRKTIVVDLSGSNSELAQKIADMVGGQVGELPEGEAQPEADILVIGGSDSLIR